MTWRPGSVLRAPLAAIALSTLAVVQAGGGANVTSTSAVPGGVPVDGGVSPERPQEVVIAVLLALGTTAPVAVAGLWPVVAAVLSALAMVLCLLAQVPPTVGAVIALGILYVVLGGPAQRLAGRGARRALRGLRDDAKSGQGRSGGRAGRRRAGRRRWRPRGGCAMRLGSGTQSSKPRRSQALNTWPAGSARGSPASCTTSSPITSRSSPLQADAARLTTPGMPAEGETRLVAIGDTARTALTEMRRLLGVLREDADGDRGVHPPAAAGLRSARTTCSTRPATPAPAAPG